jgi:hypothetical protein
MTMAADDVLKLARGAAATRNQGAMLDAAQELLRLAKVVAAWGERTLVAQAWGDAAAEWLAGENDLVSKQRRAQLSILLRNFERPPPKAGTLSHVLAIPEAAAPQLAPGASLADTAATAPRSTRRLDWLFDVVTPAFDIPQADNNELLNLLELVSLDDTLAKWIGGRDGSQDPIVKAWVSRLPLEQQERFKEMVKKADANAERAKAKPIGT